MVRYHYDGKGRRVAKHVDDSYSGSFVAQKRYEYLYEGDEPIQDYVEVSGAFAITHRYLHGASVDERLVHWAYDQNSGAETAEQFYHRDHQGSIVAMSDASGDRATGELYTYDAYGNMGLGNTDGQPFRYTGRRWDDETGLYYYRARYYSAKLGRFLQTDPIGYEDNMNLYGYVGNDPVNNTDPTGEELVVVGDEDFQKAVSDAIAKIAETEEGAFVIDQLNSTSYKIVIKPSTPNKNGDKTNRTRPENAKDAKNGEATGSTVLFNFSIKQGGEDDSGSYDRDPIVGLSHELGHALDLAAGTQSFDKGPTPPIPSSTPPSEQGSSLILENAVRATLPDHANRTHYYGPNVLKRIREAKRRSR